MGADVIAGVVLLGLGQALAVLATRRPAARHRQSRLAAARTRIQLRSTR